MPQMMVSGCVLSASRQRVSQAKARDQRSVALDLLACQVVQQPAALSDQDQHAAARMEILAMARQMLLELTDTGCQQGYLPFRRPRIPLTSPKLGHDGLFCVRSQRHSFSDTPFACWGYSSTAGF